MSEEIVYLDQNFSVVKYNNTAPLADLPLLKRRERGQIVNARVTVTNKRIVVDEKMTVLANIAAVSVGDDEREVREHNSAVERDQQKPPPEGAVGCGTLIMGLGGILVVSSVLGLMSGNGEAVGALFMGLVLVGIGLAVPKQQPPKPVESPTLTPHYAVVIESAGTRDNALMSLDRAVVQQIVRAISDALIGAPPPQATRPAASEWRPPSSSLPGGRQ